MAYLVSDIIEWAEISQALAAIGEPKKKALQLGSWDEDLHIKLYVERTSLEYAYAQDPTSDDTYMIANWVYALCGAYVFTAQQQTGGGGSISPITPTGTGFPIYITNSDFDTATTYVDDRLEGKNVIVWLNEINRYLIPGSETSVVGNTLTINLAGFDASSNSYNLVIENYSGAA